MAKKSKGWLDNYNDSTTTAPQGYVGDGYSNVGRNYSPAWGGQFEDGGSIPGAVGFSYARTQGIPYNGPYAKKTMASAQNGQEMKYYQEGLDWKPKSISQNGDKINPAAQMINAINARKQPGYHHDSPNINIKEIPRQSVNDKIATSKKLHTTDLNKLNVRNKTKAELDAQQKVLDAQELASDNAIAAERVAVRKKAEANPLHTWAGSFDPKNYTRQNFEDANADLESEFRVSDKPNFYDDWLNPLNQIGGMAADLGAAPNQIVQQDSMAPLYSAIATPVLTGVFEGHGTSNNKQFVNNLINPVNFIPGYHAAENYTTKKLNNQVAKSFGHIGGYKDGGIIQDDRGQWDHPGEVTEINSNEITMQPDPKTGKPLTKPLLGISDTGDVKIMRPGNNYKFKGNKVVEYPIAQDGKIIKVKNDKGIVENVDTASPEYAQMYKEGQIQTSHEGQQDPTYWGGELDDVKLVGKLSPLAKAKGHYDKEHGRENFINQKKDEYVKNLGDSNWYGTDRTNFPGNVLSDINANYDYDRNSAAIAQLAKQRGWDLDYRDNWVDKLNPAEREAVMSSKYSAQLNPNEFANTLSGIQQLGNTALPGNPFKFPIYGLTPKEEEEDKDSMLSGLKTFSLLNTPGNAAANYLKNTNTSSYPEYRDQSGFNLPFVDAQRMGNVDESDSMAFNPITYQGISDIPQLIKGIGNVAREVGEGSKQFKPFLNEVSQNVPKVKEFAKNVVEDISTIRDQYKHLEKLKSSKTAPSALVNTVKRVDDVKDHYNSTIPGMQHENDLYQLLHSMSNTYKNTLKDIAGDDFASRISNQWLVDLDATPLGKKIDNIVNSRITTTPEEIQRLGKELIETIPEGKSFLSGARKEMTNLQKQLIFNKDKDFETIKSFAKTIGVKKPNVSSVDYTPKEKETIAAIRELGKYTNVARRETYKLLSDPKAMININKEILKLDDDVVQKLLGIPKSKLLDSYKNIVPDLKKTQVDITSNPIAAADLQAVDNTDLLSNNSSNTLTLAEKQMQGPVHNSKPKSIVTRVSDSYAKNFGPIDFKNPTTSPEGLIGMAKTDYEYPYLQNIDGSAMVDSNGNWMYADELTSKGRTIQQLKGALDKVTAAPKGTNFIGSSSLSTDSYPLTLDSGIMMSKKGLVSVEVENGTMNLNDMGYTHDAPALAIKDINSKLEQLEKLSGKKLPRAKYNPNARSRYEMYTVPKIYFTRLKTGGSINKADENSLVNLDQLTNFTNYNTKQPGGWLNKYN